METLWRFTISSAFLGMGLAADAFAISVVNGIKYPHLRFGKAMWVSGVFALFQGFMPLLGWIIIRRIMDSFGLVQQLIPWISMLLLGYLGIKLMVEARREESGDCGSKSLTPRDLLVQGVATSVDALLVGFTLAAYGTGKAFICSLIISAVTFCICYFGISWGKLLGLRFAGKATALGGIVLVAMALEHLFQGVIR